MRSPPSTMVSVLTPGVVPLGPPPPPGALALAMDPLLVVIPEWYV